MMLRSNWPLDLRGMHTDTAQMKFCSRCGDAVTLRIPTGDNRERAVCDSCDTIHYRNPRIIAGCLAVHEDKVLLCKRSIEPRSGLWTLPAGFMENGETVEEAAARETREEACAEVELQGLLTVNSIPHISQVYMIFLARLLDGQHAAGEETEATQLVSFDQIPWDQLAFPVMRQALQDWQADTRSTRLSSIDLRGLNPRSQ